MCVRERERRGRERDRDRRDSISVMFVRLKQTVQIKNTICSRICKIVTASDIFSVLYKLRHVRSIVSMLLWILYSSSFKFKSLI